MQNPRQLGFDKTSLQSQFNHDWERKLSFNNVRSMYRLSLTAILFQWSVDSDSVMSQREISVLCSWNLRLLVFKLIIITVYDI